MDAVSLKPDYRSRLVASILCATLLISPAIVKAQEAGVLRYESHLKLDKTRYKATHNSYRLNDSPLRQILDYNVWEIELDFGLMEPDGDFLVGHDAPETRYGLTTLGDYVRRIRDSAATMEHPIIIKLEAKTSGSCGQYRFLTFVCGDLWDERWQQRLADSMAVWLGPDSWFTKAEFEKNPDGWPTVTRLSGKYIITLQDNSDGRYVDESGVKFFPQHLPGLTEAWPPIEDATDFGRAVKRGCNRLIMDEAYSEPFSNVLVHPPVPCFLSAAGVAPYSGTAAYPFRPPFELYTAVALATNGQLKTLSDILEKPKESWMTDVPLSIAVAVFVSDWSKAGTNDSVTIEFLSMFSRFPFPAVFSPGSLERAGVAVSGTGGSLPFRFPPEARIYVSRDDDIAIDSIVVTTNYQSYIRTSATVGTWIGTDHKNPLMVHFSR